MEVERECSKCEVQDAVIEQETRAVVLEVGFKSNRFVINIGDVLGVDVPWGVGFILERAEIERV